MARITGPVPGEVLGGAAALLAGVAITACAGAISPHTRASAIPAMSPSASAPAAPIQATGTALISLNGSCSLGWDSPLGWPFLPNTPAGYQQSQSATGSNGLPQPTYYTGYQASVTNDTGAPVLITSVTVDQSFPDSADEPPVSFTPDGGPELVEPGQSESLNGYFDNGQVLGGGQLFDPSPETFEQGSCSASFDLGTP
jgi:hypothetical protein